MVVNGWSELASAFRGRCCFLPCLGAFVVLDQEQFSTEEGDCSETVRSRGEGRAGVVLGPAAAARDGGALLRGQSRGCGWYHTACDCAGTAAARVIFHDWPDFCLWWAWASSWFALRAFLAKATQVWISDYR